MTLKRCKKCGFVRYSTLVTYACGHTFRMCCIRRRYVMEADYWRRGDADDMHYDDVLMCPSCYDPVSVCSTLYIPQTVTS